MNVKTAAEQLLKAPFPALGMDVVQWRPPNSQPVIPPEELEMIAGFGPQYKPEDHWLANVPDISRYLFYRMSLAQPLPHPCSSVAC